MAPQRAPDARGHPGTHGDPVVLTPFFEEPSVRQTLGIPAEVRVWQEDESPIALAAAVLRSMGAARGT